MQEEKRQYDKIHIKDILIRCIIGINDDERINKQDVIINVTLYTDLKKPGITDNIDDTVDYKTIKKEIIKRVEQSSYNLIEKLAEEIANLCLKNKKVIKAKISVDKPTALRFAKSVSVEITRFNNNEI